MTDNIKRQTVPTQFGLTGPWGGGTRRPVDPGTNRQQPARRSRARSYPKFGDEGEATSHEDRLRAMIGGDR
ncbi:hypothetical protein A1351_23215 [Methylosinus sp. R-45379]|nr:hypothetical protein A1351_23215 [Methylosinus sp. R-45379]